MSPCLSTLWKSAKLGWFGTAVSRSNNSGSNPRHLLGSSRYPRFFPCVPPSSSVSIQHTPTLNFPDRSRTRREPPCVDGGDASSPDGATGLEIWHGKGKGRC